MQRLIESPKPEMRALSRDEISEVAGGVISEGVHHLQTHVPGRLDPDGSEIGTIAGAGL